MVKTYPARITN